MIIDPTREEERVLTQAFERWGNQKQIGMAMEECAETIAALNHYERGRVGIEKVIDEFADAFVCVGQVIHSEQRLIDLEVAIGSALGKLKAKLENDDWNFVEGRPESIQNSPAEDKSNE